MEQRDVNRSALLGPPLVAAVDFSFFARVSEHPTVQIVRYRVSCGLIALWIMKKGVHVCMSVHVALLLMEIENVRYGFT